MAQELTPVGALLQRWLDEHHETAAELGRRLGVGRTAMWNYMHLPERVPEPQKLAEIGQVTGIPLHLLYEAAGVPIPSTALDPWDAVMAQIDHEPRLTARQRRELIADIGGVRDRYRAAVGARPGRPPTTDGTTPPPPTAPDGSTPVTP